VLIFDASSPCEIDALHAQALELCLRRTGVRTLTLTAELDASRLAHVLQALTPQVVVLTGRRPWLDALSRIAYQSRRTVDVVDFRGALPDSDAEAVPRLGMSALGARDMLLAHLNLRDESLRGRSPLLQAL
jgi:hypothetical protein